MASIDPRVFEDPLKRVLAGIRNLADGQPEPWTTGLHVSNHLRTQCGISIHWRTINAILGKRRALVVRRKRRNRWEYMLLDAGKAEITGSVDTILVDPSTALQATLKLHDILAKVTGAVRICDPYLDEKTIEHLAACPKNQPLRLLTMNVRDSGTLRRVVAAAKASSYQLEIRVVAAAVLHDRYVIDDKSMFILGTSLNGFGKKQSFVIRAGDDMRGALLAAFDALWLAAAPWS